MGYKLPFPRAEQSLTMLFSSISIPNCPKGVTLSLSHGNPLRAEPVPHIFPYKSAKDRRNVYCKPAVEFTGTRAGHPYESRQSLRSALFHYPSFRIRKLRSREVKGLASSHTASRQSWVQTTVCLAPAPALPPVLYQQPRAVQKSWRRKGMAGPGLCVCLLGLNPGSQEKGQQVSAA